MAVCVYDGAVERCSAEQIKKFYLFHAKWKLVLDLGVASSAEQQRRAWPVGPDDFDALVEGKVFTNGSDLDAVKALYRKMSVGQLGSIKMLDFDGMPEMSVEDGRRLGGCLALCGRLEKLDLQNAGISDEACEAIFASLGSGALDKLTVSWRPTALSPCPETCHMHSPDSYLLFDVHYAVP